jgi:hypothetical protein
MVKIRLKSRVSPSLRLPISVKLLYARPRQQSEPANFSATSNQRRFGLGI